MSEAIKVAADRLLDAQRTYQPCAPVREVLGKHDLEAAYAVQEILTRLALQDGRRLVGRKIGLTAASVQRQLGVDQPDFGMLFADMAIVDGEPIPIGRVLQPKVEAEVALVLEHDLDMEQPTLSDVIRAIAFALPAIEVVGSRIKDWDITIVDTIADNASSGAYVLGASPCKLNKLDLRLCGMAMFRAGEVVSTGAGLACLGHPLHAAQWLAATMMRVGHSLKAGDIILTGALGPMVAAAPGDVFEARIEGLGRVSASFAGEAS